MAKSKRQANSAVYLSRARVLKKWGLIDIDLRRPKARAFSGTEKSRITKLWKATEPVHNLDVKVIKVKKSTQTGNRMRVGNSVFVSREGADRVTFNKKTGTITKTIKQAGGRKRIRAPMNPQAQDVDKVFEQLSEKEVLMLRSASGKGITSGGNAYDKKAWISYKAERQKTIAAQVRRTQGLNAKDARKYAKQIMDDWYTVEVEYDDEE